MPNRKLAVLAAGALAILCCATVDAVDIAKGWKAPRTTDGHPDLQGVWTNATITPLERQPQFGDRLSITEARSARRSSKRKPISARNKTNRLIPKLGILDLPKDCGGGFSGVNCGYNNFWVDPGSHMISINGERRTSIVVEPKNGRVPCVEARSASTSDEDVCRVSIKRRCRWS